MEGKYSVFVPPTELDEDRVQHYEVIDWCFNNLSHPNVLVLDQSDVHLLSYESQALIIINKEIGGMIGEWEGDWIMEEGPKLSVLEKLTSYADTLGYGRERAIVKRILSLLNIAIQTNKGIYFHF